MRTLTQALTLTSISTAVRSRFVGVLDQISAPTAAAYSLRRLKRSYTGPLIRVRRGSDNAEAEFSAVETSDAHGNRWLDTAALLAFCGAGSGFVTTWYDQSGSARDVLQANALNQTRIVNAGILDIQNTRPTLVFFGNQFLRADNGFTYTSNCVMLAGQYNSPQSVNQGFFQFGATNSNGSMLVEASNLQVRVVSGVGSYTIVDNSGVFRVFTGEWGAALRRLRVNGADVSSTTASNTFTAADTSLNVGNLADAYMFTGVMSELVVCGNSVTTETRQLIERNQGTAFGITVA